VLPGWGLSAITFFCSFHALMLKKALEDRIEALMIDLRP
jgi:hypothetical protein